MARADAFALPSSPEGFGLVYAESLAQGTAGDRLSRRRSRRLRRRRPERPARRAGRRGGVAAALARLLDEPATAARLAAAGRAAVADLTWPRNAARQLAIYEQVLGAAPGTRRRRRERARQGRPSLGRAPSRRPPHLRTRVPHPGRGRLRRDLPRARRHPGPRPPRRALCGAAGAAARAALADHAPTSSSPLRAPAPRSWCTRTTPSSSRCTLLLRPFVPRLVYDVHEFLPEAVWPRSTSPPACGRWWRPRATSRSAAWRLGRRRRHGHRRHAQTTSARGRRCA